MNVNSHVNTSFPLFGFTLLNYARSTGDGSGTVPRESVNIAADYGRSAADSASHVSAPGCSVTREISASALRHRALLRSSFNIVTGEDSNGDSIFNDRPAFAPNANCADTNDFACTAYGNFLLHPGPGTPVIPRNYGTGPEYFAINIRLSRTWGFGEPDADADTSTIPAQKRGFWGDRLRGGATMSLSGEARNLLNNVDPSTPINVLDSSRFGQSTGLAGGYGPGGATANNRRVTWTTLQFLTALKKTSPKTVPNSGAGCVPRCAGLAPVCGVRGWPAPSMPIRSATNHRQRCVRF